MVMTPSLDLDPNTRLIVVAPHPDDETLATGELIQAALAAGAHLRVIVATDGDNNPWPQRWVEKRLRIDAAARARWGARRRNESIAALARLGVAREHARFLGWADQGITDLLMQGPEAASRLAAEISEFMPNLIVAPSLADRHSDHNAMGVLLALALSESGQSGCRRLGYIVHGEARAGARVALPANSARSVAKLEALQAHASQMVLSAGRMTRLGMRAEQYESDDDEGSGSGSRRLDWQMPLPSSGLPLHRRALYLVVESGGQVSRTRILLPRLLARTRLDRLTDAEAGVRLSVRSEAGHLHCSLSATQPIRRIHAKLERLGPRILIYDDHGWYRQAG